MAKRSADDETTESPAATATSTTRASKRAKTDPVRKANAMSAKVFEERFLEQVNLEHVVRRSGAVVEFDVTHHHVKSMAQDDFDACFDLIRTTSQVDYEASSLRWQPDVKKKEMKDTDMHYLLVKRRHSSDTADKRTTGIPPLEGFLSFMITHESQPRVPVLYVYEIHLVDSARHLGLGTKLFDIGEQIALEIGVEKVMLTCFLSNVNARHFYHRLGYSKDPDSPADRRTRNKVIKADYAILSKVLIRD